MRTSVRTQLATAPAPAVLPTTSRVRPPASCRRQEQFEDISVAAVEELWSQYGPLAEIWFDGGISERIKGRIVPLLRRLQPDAVTMGAGIENSQNNVDWVGTESGMPAYPVWSSGCTSPGAGSRGEPPDVAANFCPKCGDCTLQAPDKWFWEPDAPIKPLSQLIDMYHGTVGSNSVMELDFAVDRTGRIDPTHAARYKEFGEWIDGCYGAPLAQTLDFVNGSVAEVATTGAGSGGELIDRVMIMEDLQYGQRVLSYKVETLRAVPALGNGPVQVVEEARWPQWMPFSNGTAVGHKRIDIVPRAIGVDKHSRIRVTITASAAPPVIKLLVFKVYQCARS